MSQHGIFFKRALVLLPLVVLFAACDKVRNAARQLEKKAVDAPGAAAASHVSQLSGDDYESFTAQQGKVVVIDFYADWCGPCRKLAPLLERIAAENAGLVLIGKVNVDQNRELAGQRDVRSIPDVRVFRNGRQVDRFVGAPSETQVRERIEAHTKGLSPAAAGTGGSPAAEEPQPAITPATKDWLPPGIERR